MRSPYSQLAGLVLFLIIHFSGIESSGQDPGTQKWIINTPSIIYSSPALAADGTLFLGLYYDGLAAYNPDGSLEWTFETEGNIRSSPSIGTDGTIYIGSLDRKLYAVNPDSTQKWVFETGNSIYSTPAIDRNGIIYIGSLDKKLYALRPDGTKLWEFETGQAIYSSAAIGVDGTIYVGSNDDKVYAIKPDGSKLWEYQTGGDLVSGPAIGMDGTVYIGSKDDKLYAIHPDGTLKWLFETGGDIISSPAIGFDGTIYVGSNDGNLYAINPDGSERWRFQGSCGFSSTPAIGKDGTVIVSNYCNSIYALTPEGVKKWELWFGGNIYSSPAIATDGTIYMGTRSSLRAIYSDCGGLASSPWPKYGRNARNTGLFTGLSCQNTFKAVMLDPGQTAQVSFDLVHNEEMEITIDDFFLNGTVDFTLNTSLPMSMVAGSRKTISFQFTPGTSDYFQNPFELSYSSDGVSEIVSGEAPVAVIIQDGSETAYTGEKAIAAYEEAKNNDEEIAQQNNKGVILRLLGEPYLAGGVFQGAISGSLSEGFGFAGIKMNMGVVNSDQGNSDSAYDLYEDATGDISPEEASSALAPQIYFNEAWEAYHQDELTEVLENVLLITDHDQANDFLKAKAFTLWGAVRVLGDSIPEARSSFRTAISLDPAGPVGRIAYENLKAISQPLITGSPDDITICKGDDLVLKVSVSGEEPYDFFWVKDESLIRNVTADVDSMVMDDITSDQSGNYQCIVENEFGRDTVLFTLSVISPEKPLITQTGETSICEGEILLLSTTEAASYLWSDGQKTQSIAATDSHNFSVIVTDGYGCVSPPSDTLRVSVYPVPDQPLISQSGEINLCEGDTVALSSSDEFSFNWSTGQDSRGIEVFAPGTYFVVTSNEYGCASQPSDSAIIMVFPTPVKPEISPAGELSICDGEELFLTAPNAASFSWSTGEDTRKIRITTEGSYAVSVVNEFGCSSPSSDTVNLEVNPLPEKPSVEVSGRTLSSSSVTGNQWYLGESLIQGATDQEFVVMEDGEYSVAFTDQNGCTSMSESVQVIVTDVQNMSVGNKISIYPNPNSGSFYLKLSKELASSDTELRIYNSGGQLVLTQSIPATPMENGHLINLTDIPVGMYHLLLVSNEAVFNLPLIIH